PARRPRPAPPPGPRAGTPPDPPPAAPARTPPSEPGPGWAALPRSSPPEAALPPRRAGRHAPALLAPAGGMATPRAPPRGPGAPRANASAGPLDSCRRDGRTGQPHAHVPQPARDLHVLRRATGPALG